MRKLLLCIVFNFAVVISFAQSKDEIEIRSALDNDVKSWNNGNIDAFMDTYWKSDSLMFIGKSGVTYGWQNTLNNYKKSYPDTSTMGKLDFTIIDIKRLSVLYFHVVGKWHLKRSGDLKDLEGHFTLLFKKIKGKWVIVTDHSS